MPVQTDLTNKKETTHPAEPSVTCDLQPEQGLRPGMTCPRCKQGTIDYNGLLELICPVCGLKETGACT